MPQSELILILGRGFSCKFRNKHLVFLCGEVKGSLCLLGISSTSVISLADDSEQVKYHKFAVKPFKNQLVVG